MVSLDFYPSSTPLQISEVTTQTRSLLSEWHQCMRSGWAWSPATLLSRFIVCDQDFLCSHCTHAASPHYQLLRQYQGIRVRPTFTEYQVRAADIRQQSTLARDSVKMWNIKQLNVLRLGYLLFLNTVSDDDGTSSKYTLLANKLAEGNR